MELIQCDKGAGDAQKKLSRQETDDMYVSQGMRLVSTALIYFSTALNQLNSPLLRLPGELRNRIYEYVLGGLTIRNLENVLSAAHVVHEPVGLEQYGARAHGTVVPVYASSDVSDEPWYRYQPKTVLLHVNLLKVCRQIYSETHLLPFQLNAFEIHHEKLGHFLGNLTVAQRDAITTFKIGDTRDIGAGAGDWRFDMTALSWRLYRPDQLLMAWSGFHNLLRMRGLRQVVFEHAFLTAIGAPKGRQEKEDMITVKMEEYVKGLPVKIAFEWASGVRTGG
jgi:hypothetical protein